MAAHWNKVRVIGGLKPDLVKRGCSYYGESKIEIIKRKLKRVA